jgi:hypothetical protein
MQLNSRRGRTDGLYHPSIGQRRQLDDDIRGPASTVETNRGTAGDLVKTGTATDTTW